MVPKPDVLLTIVVVGRNDDYHGDYLYRLGTALDMLGRNLARIGRLDAVEVLVVDWASPTPLRTALRLEPAAAAVVGFIEVPEAMAQAAAPGMPFYVTLAVNVGVRRARGRFVALGDSDCLYTAVTLSNLLSLLEGRTDPSLDVERLMMPLRRYQVPWEFVHRQPDIPTLERYLRIAFNAFRTEMTGAGLMGGFAGAQLMHRDIWMRVRGYNEALTAPWGWGDNELHIRVNQHHGWLDPAYYGVALFHLEHHSVHRPKSGARVPNKMLIEAGFVANGPDWGLGGQDLPVRRAEPGAAEEVPPLLPLSGRFADLDRAALQAERTDVRAVTETCLRHFRDALAAGGQGRVPPDVTIGLMRTLVAFCCVEHPVNVVFLGDLGRHPVEAVLNACPAIEAYLIGFYPPGVTDDHPCHPGILSGVFNMARYKGYAALIGGPAETALERIRAAQPGLGPLELVVADQRSLGDAFEAVSAGAFAALAPGGAIVVLCEPGTPVPGIAADPEGRRVLSAFDGRLLTVVRTADQPSEPAASAIAR
jgi:hypothetical protein